VAERLLDWCEAAIRERGRPRAIRELREEIRKTRSPSPPATPPAPPAPEARKPPRVPAELARAEAIMQFSKLLHLSTEETLEEIVRLLEYEKKSIEGINKIKRVSVARGILRMLGLNVEDLRPVA
jgi:hypothetical protein